MALFALFALAVLGTTALLAAALFVSAGRWDLPALWIYVALVGALKLLGLAFVSPELVKEWIRPGPGARKDLYLVLGTPLWLAHFVIAGLDVGRFHWSDTVPVALQAAGLIALGAGQGILLWAVAVNPFFSGVIRIQRERGHRVITGGPYQYVRHPGYTGALVLALASGLALGSWLSILPLLPAVLLLFRRTRLEDRVLAEELERYAPYAKRVRYRLIPGLW